MDRMKRKEEWVGQKGVETRKVLKKEQSQQHNVCKALPGETKVRYPS